MKKGRKEIFLLTLVYLAATSYAIPPVTSDLVLSLDGDHVTTSGSSVISMVDQSGNGHDAVSDSARPNLVENAINGYDVVDFTAGSQGNSYLKIPPSSQFDTDELTLFIVYKYDPSVDLRYGQYLMTMSYDLDDNGTSIQYRLDDHGASAIERTIAVRDHDKCVRGLVHNKVPELIHERVYPFYGFTGWNLVVMTWDPETDPDDNVTLDGDMDVFCNPFTSDFPTLEDSLAAQWGNNDGEAGDYYTIENHIMGMIGGKPDYYGYVGDPYPGYFSISYDNDFEGMVAEVAMYTRALSPGEIESVSGYLNQKYDCGSGPQLAVVPKSNECQYSIDSTRNRLISDLSADCAVNLADFAELAEDWLNSY